MYITAKEVSCPLGEELKSNPPKSGGYVIFGDSTSTNVERTVPLPIIGFFFKKISPSSLVGSGG